MAPVASGGITSIDAPTFSLFAYESPTGVKFFLTARPKMEAQAQHFLARVYEAYADYVLKVRSGARDTTALADGPVRLSRLHALARARALAPSLASLALESLL